MAIKRNCYGSINKRGRLCYVLPAAELPSYTAFLLALFVIATGVCCLQVSANPYVTSMGSELTAANRLNLTQGFNSLGTTVAPLLRLFLFFLLLLNCRPVQKSTSTLFSNRFIISVTGTIF